VGLLVLDQGPAVCRVGKHLLTYCLFTLTQPSGGFTRFGFCRQKPLVAMPVVLTGKTWC